MNTLPLLASERECTGCLACVDICHVSAIRRIVREDGHIYSEIDPEICVGCKKCEKVCTNARVQYGTNEINKTQPFAAWAHDGDLRQRSTSGGVFAALAVNVIQRGGYVVGACFDGKRCFHKMISTIEDVSLLQGSKYTESSMLGIYREIAEVLPNHLVLFSGLGCQVGAVLSFFRKHPQKENLITVDLVCGGAPSTLLIDAFLEHNKGVESLLSFRTKGRYELKGVINGQPVVIDSPSLPLTGFAKELTNRYSCSDCKFTFAHRSSDITIGDLWGDKQYPEEHDKGVSLVLCHSEKGGRLLNEAPLIKHPVKWSQFLPFNKRIVMGKKHIYSLRNKLAQNYLRYSYEKFHKLYTLDIKPYDLCWFPFKVYHVLWVKYEQKKALRLVNEILKQEN